MAPICRWMRDCAARLCLADLNRAHNNSSICRSTPLRAHKRKWRMPLRSRDRAREKQREQLGGGAIADGETRAKNASGNARPLSDRLYISSPTTFTTFVFQIYLWSNWALLRLICAVPRLTRWLGMCLRTKFIWRITQNMSPILVTIQSYLLLHLQLSHHV
jgi:hypothetical protein